MLIIMQPMVFIPQIQIPSSIPFFFFLVLDGIMEFPWFTELPKNFIYKFFLLKIIKTFASFSSDFFLISFYWLSLRWHTLVVTPINYLSLNVFSHILLKQKNLCFIATNLIQNFCSSVLIILNLCQHSSSIWCYVQTEEKKLAFCLSWKISKSIQWSVFCDITEINKPVMISSLTCYRSPGQILEVVLSQCMEKWISQLELKKMTRQWKQLILPVLLMKGWET